MVKLQYSRPAITDLHNIFLYISNDSVINARRFINSLKQRIKILKVHPEMGKPVFPQRFPYIKQVLYKSYRIIYQYQDDMVTILVITHQERLIENIEAIKQYLI
jgi:toxin ParE1/3/4